MEKFKRSAMKAKKKSKRGGRRAGAGRPRIPDEIKKIMGTFKRKGLRKMLQSGADQPAVNRFAINTQRAKLHDRSPS
jgi:hypothetical protein